MKKITHESELVCSKLPSTASSAEWEPSVVLCVAPDSGIPGEQYNFAEHDRVKTAEYHGNNSMAKYGKVDEKMAGLICRS